MYKITQINISKLDLIKCVDFRFQTTILIITLFLYNIGKEYKLVKLARLYVSKIKYQKILDKMTPWNNLFLFCQHIES